MSTAGQGGAPDRVAEDPARCKESRAQRSSPAWFVTSMAFTATVPPVASSPISDTPEGSVSWTVAGRLGVPFGVAAIVIVPPCGCRLT